MLRVGNLLELGASKFACEWHGLMQAGPSSCLHAPNPVRAEMDTQKKRPMGYADLSIVQLKTFADRGDARAKEELAKRLGMNAAAAPSSRAAGVAPGVGSSSLGRSGAASQAGVEGRQPTSSGMTEASVGLRPEPQLQDLPAERFVERSSVEPAQGVPPDARLSTQLASGSTNGLSANRAAAQASHGAGQIYGNLDQRNSTGQTIRSPGQAGEVANMSPQAAAALRQAEALLAAASPRLVSTPNPTPHGANLLINDAPGASGCMSPELLARLEEIARNAPDDDEPQPPVFLGLGMMILGAIVALFGFSVTRGQHGTWYFVACGLAMAASGWLYFKGMKLAVPAYALTCVTAVLWAVYESPTWLEAMLRVGVPLLIAGYVFLPRVRQTLV